MLPLIAPGLALFAIIFGLVGWFVGMAPFVGFACIALPLSVAVMVRERLRLSRAARLRVVGARVSATVTKVEHASYLVWGRSPARVSCIAVAPTPFRGITYRTPWFIPGAASLILKDMPVTVFADGSGSRDFHVDLSAFGASDKRLDFRSLRVPIAIGAFAVVSVFVTSWIAGVGPRGLVPPSASGTVTSSGAIAGSWTFAAADCRSGEPTGIHGVTIFDAPQSGHYLTFVLDPINGAMLVTNIPNEEKDYRYFASDCSFTRAELSRTGSVVNRVTNVEGGVDAECSAEGNTLSAHVSFRTCH